MVLFTILKNVFSIGKKVDDVKKVITSTLIAGVLIQASWFLTAALIDISTIATYGIWALPMSVLEWTKVGDQKILAVDSVMDIDKSFDDNQNGDAFKTAFRVKYNWKDVFLSPCLLKRNSTWDWWETYIVWRKYFDKKYQNYDVFWGKTACVVNSKQVVIYNEFSELIWREGSDYENNLNWILSIDSDRHPREFCGYVINSKWNKNEGNGCWDWFEEITEKYNLIADDSADDEISKRLEQKDVNWIWAIAWEEWFKSKEVESITISQLVDKSKWLVGPMMTIFSSMMNFAQISEHSQDNWVWAIWMETLIKALFALAIFFPLLALTLVLIARIWILRLVVAGSPFIVLVKIFKDQLGKSLWSLADKVDLWNIIKIVFSPVIVVFALSMSIIFLQTLISGFNNTEWKNCSRQKEIWESLMISPVYTAEQEKNNDCKTDEYVFLDWLIKIKANWTFDWSGTGDLLSRTMVNIMAIGLVRFLLFAAIKASWKLWEAVWKWVQDFWSSVMKTMPILPVPWATTERAWIWAWKEWILWSWWNNAIWNRKINQMEQDQEMAVGEILNKKNNKDNTSWTSTDNTDKSKQIVEYVQSNTAANMEDINKKIWGNTEQNAEYITNPVTLKEFEKLQSAIDDNTMRTNALTWLVALLSNSIDERIKWVKTKEELEKIILPVYNSKDSISTEYINSILDKKEFEISDGTNKKKYKLKKNSDKPELIEETSTPTPPTAPTP